MSESWDDWDPDVSVCSTQSAPHGGGTADLCDIPDAIPGHDQIDAFVHRLSPGVAAAEAFDRLAETMREFGDTLRAMARRASIEAGWTRYAPLVPQSWIPRRLSPSRGISPRRNRGRSLPGGKRAALRLA